MLGLFKQWQNNTKIQKNTFEKSYKLICILMSEISIWSIIAKHDLVVVNHRGQVFLVVGLQVCTHLRRDFVPLLFVDIYIYIFFLLNRNTAQQLNTVEQITLLYIVTLYITLTLCIACVALLSLSYTNVPLWFNMLRYHFSHRVRY